MNASSGSGAVSKRISTEPRKPAASDGASCDLLSWVVAKPALSESIQDYLKAIYKLQDESGKVTVSGLARCPSWRDRAPAGGGGG